MLTHHHSRPARGRARLIASIVASTLAVAFLVAGWAPAATSEAVGNPAPVVETEPVEGTGDAADDPAIWVHPTDPSLSLVIGSDKAADNLDVYDLAGRLLQRIPEIGGSLNNVDLRPGLLLDGERVDIVGTSGSDLRFYKIDPATRLLTDVTARTIRPEHGAAGVCMYSSVESGRMYAFATAGNGNVEQFEIFDRGDGLIDARSVRGPWDAHPEPVTVHDGEIEACATDDETGHLYVSEQDLTVWKYGAEPTDSTAPADRTAIGGTPEFNGGPMAADIEGLAVVSEPDGKGFIVASSQGDDSFGVYRRQAPHEFVRKLQVVNGPAADGCSRTDGIAAVAVNLGPAFPKGLFVCQDNANTLPTGNQNFKLVRLEQVVPLGEPVPTTTTTTTAPTTTTTAPTPTTTTTTTAPTTTTTAPTTTTTRPASDPTGTFQGTPPTGTQPGTKRSGYWMLDSAGHVYAFGDARHLGDAIGRISAPATAVDLEPTPSSAGYWVLDSRGSVHAAGDATSFGSLVGQLRPGESATSLSATPSGRGYWLFTSLGRVIPFGDARFLGDMAGTRLNGPVLDSIATPTGLGYYMVASDGGIFAFGDAAFHGSMGSVRLNAPVTGMVPYGNGYLMVATDGGIFNFSDRPFSGSLGTSPPSDPVTSVAVAG